MAPKPSRGDRIRQIRAAYDVTRQSDPQLLLYLVAAFLVPLVVLLVIGFVIGHPIYLGVIGFLLGLAAAMTMFTRRATHAAFAQVEGQGPGAAVSVLQAMRGDWRVTPAVQVTTSQDMVHRVVGRPGIILVGEGTSRRLGALMGQEKKRVGRLVGDTPVYDIVAGNDEGQIPLRKLQNYFVKLPRNLEPREVNAVDKRLQALGGMNIPMPKGPLPKGARLPKGAKMPRR